MSTDTAEIAAGQPAETHPEMLSEVLSRLDAIEQRLTRLEQAAHTEHSLSSETIGQIVDAAVQKMNDHLHLLLAVGKTLLQKP